MTDLSGRWSLADETGEHVVPFDLPGDAITALHAGGVIPDPYWGRNEYLVRWVAARDWQAERTFIHDGSPADLVIDGLDTVAEVAINGTPVLSAANSFRRFRVPAQGLRSGENTIAITFRSNLRAADALQASMPFPIPYSTANSPIPNGNMLRKVQCDFGWDWNLAVAPFGLYGCIRLVPPGNRIIDIVVQQNHADGWATVVVEVHTTAEDVTASLCGSTVSAKSVNGLARVGFSIRDPELWWPAGLGSQVLHELIVTAGTAVATRRIGLRSLELVSEPDAAGRSFRFRVNGHPVFARGSNWIPADALAGRITPEATRALLQSAVDANQNTIRVWGGGRYEADWFYDICDELGLMVWQDFMFSCNLYPSTPDFLSEVDAEVRDVVARLNHHACIALWCGDNELIGALTRFPQSRADLDRYLVSYDRLNRTIETALKATAPGVNWWPSSPSPGPMAFGDAWHDDSAGDMHFWSVWHEGCDFDHYRDVRPRFCSEFGFQSYPSMSAIRRFADPADFNIAAPVIESHQKNAGGNARIAETMFRYFRFPVGFENFVYLSQVQQGLAIKTAVTQWRGLKPHCQGTLYWQLNDTWPVCSWASLDHGGNWKLLHHMAKDFFAPVQALVVREDGKWLLKAVNDTRDPVQIDLTLRAASVEGNLRDLAQVSAEVPTDRAVTLAVLDTDGLAPQEFLVWQFTTTAGQGGCDVWSQHPWKAHDLQPPRITMTVAPQAGAFTVTLAAQAPAFYVALESDTPGRFSDNAFTLFPGFPARVTFTPDDPGASPRFTTRDLHSATHGATSP